MNGKTRNAPGARRAGSSTDASPAVQGTTTRPSAVVVTMLEEAAGEAASAEVARGIVVVRVAVTGMETVEARAVVAMVTVVVTGTAVVTEAVVAKETVVVKETEVVKVVEDKAAEAKAVVVGPVKGGPWCRIRVMAMISRRRRCMGGERG